MPCLRAWSYDLRRQSCSQVGIAREELPPNLWARGDVRIGLLIQRILRKSGNVLIFSFARLSSSRGDILLPMSVKVNAPFGSFFIINMSYFTGNEVGSSVPAEKLLNADNVARIRVIRNFEIYYGTEQLGHAPSLCDATAWSVRSITIKDFGNLAQTSFVQMLLKAFEPPRYKVTTRLAAERLDIGSYEWTD